MKLLVLLLVITTLCFTTFVEVKKQNIMPEVVMLLKTDACGRLYPSGKQTQFCCLESWMMKYLLAVIEEASIISK